MKRNTPLLLCFLLSLILSPAWGQEVAQKVTKEKLTLYNSVMCEDVQDREPFNPTVVFPISRGKAYCYTLFEPVPVKTYIYHNWYRRDVLSFTIRLQVQPPSWATYSNIQLRESDRGPWRVEITDAEGNTFQTLRFSVTE